MAVLVGTAQAHAMLVVTVTSDEAQIGIAHTRTGVKRTTHRAMNAIGRSRRDSETFGTSRRADKGNGMSRRASEAMGKSNRANKGNGMRRRRASKGNGKLAATHNKPTSRDRPSLSCTST